MPQTLLYSVMLLYFDAAMGLLGLLGFGIGGSAYVWVGVLFSTSWRSTSGLATLAVLVATGAYTFAALGIANGQRIGWKVGVVVASGAIVLPALALVRGYNLGGTYFVTLMFNLALVVLLLHKQSRDYQRIWFEGPSGGRSGPRRL